MVYGSGVSRKKCTEDPIFFPILRFSGQSFENIVFANFCFCDYFWWCRYRLCGFLIRSKDLGDASSYTLKFGKGRSFVYSVRNSAQKETLITVKVVFLKKNKASTENWQSQADTFWILIHDSCFDPWTARSWLIPRNIHGLQNLMHDSWMTIHDLIRGQR